MCYTIIFISVYFNNFNTLLSSFEKFMINNMILIKKLLFLLYIFINKYIVFIVTDKIYRYR